MMKQLPLTFEFRANQTFNDFFAAGNQEIITHLQSCIEGTGEQQIFLWGESGLGKSHLLQACCHQAHQQGLSVFYFSMPTHELPDPALLTGLEKYELVCFDNIDNIAGDKVWELAFFNFFNQHRGLGLDHRLILTATSSPDQLNIQLPDLKTRLNWGLTLKIKPLVDDDKIEALIFRADQLGFQVSPQVSRFLLTHFDRDLASLWTLLDKLDKASLAAKRKLTIPFLKKLLNL